MWTGLLRVGKYRRSPGHLCIKETRRSANVIPTNEEKRTERKAVLRISPHLIVS